MDLGIRVARQWMQWSSLGKKGVTRPAFGSAGSRQLPSWTTSTRDSSLSQGHVLFLGGPHPEDDYHGAGNYLLILCHEISIGLRSGPALSLPQVLIPWVLPAKPWWHPVILLPDVTSPEIGGMLAVHPGSFRVTDNAEVGWGHWLKNLTVFYKEDHTL